MLTNKMKNGDAIFSKAAGHEASLKYKIKRLGCVPCTSYKIWREQLPRMNFKLYEIISERYFNQPLITGFMEPEK
ncbi:unnamed protein product [marine sediment metagenome]|uniref:Uncharacterized protein n=1 Tax=marine sediment metagenome TaxID=412755 RepID=X1SMF9_9ZZZZ